MKSLLIIPFSGKYILAEAETPSDIPLKALIDVVPSDYAFQLTDAVSTWHSRQKEGPVIPTPESP